MSLNGDPSCLLTSLWGLTHLDSSASSIPHTPWHRPSAALGMGWDCAENPGVPAVCAVTGQQADWRGDCHCHVPQLCKWGFSGGVAHSLLHCQVSQPHPSFLRGRWYLKARMRSENNIRHIARLPRLSPQRFTLRLPANIVQTEGKPRCFQGCTPNAKCNLSLETV